MPERKENMQGLLLTLEVLRRASSRRWVKVEDIQQQVQSEDPRFVRSLRNYQKMFAKLVAEGLLEVDASSKPFKY